MSLLGGIDLGGTKIQAVVVDEDHQVLGEARVPTPTLGGPQDVADAMAGALREAAEGHGDPAAVGVGSPGVIDEAAGVVSSARNLPGWVGLFLPAGTPEPVIARYSETLRKVLADADLRKRIEELGFLPVGNTRAEFAGYIQSELVAWAAIVRDNNIKLD